MQKIIELCNDYLYVIDTNQIINKELYPCFARQDHRRTIVNEEIHVDKNRLIRETRNISKLIFETNQSCNMRCRHCVYGEHYYYERKHTHVSMDFNAARQGLDYIFGWIKDRINNELAVGFFGGEPFINFDLIREIVRYAKLRFTGWNLRFSVTTNGTYLNPGILSFLKENDFSLRISLDGDKEAHDNKRIFPDGTGSFDLVWHNIEKIATLEPEYYKAKVKFNTVLSKDYPLPEVFRFFTGNGLVNNSPISLNFIVDKNTDYFHKYPYNPRKFIGYLDEVVRNIGEKIVKGSELKPIEQLMLSRKINEKGLFKKNHSNLGAACLFGAKLFIDCLGNFHACEQINNKFSYGDVYEGFDFEKMLHIIDSYKQINTEFCSDCGVRFLCGRCYVTFAGDGEFTFNAEYCRERKRNIIDKLSNHVEFNKRVMNQKSSSATKSNLVKKFHQFVKLEKGPVKTAVIDFLKGNIFQVENDMIAAFEKGKYHEIQELVAAMEREELLITVTGDTWIPESLKDKNQLAFLEALAQSSPLQLEIEEGVDMGAIKEKFKDLNLLLVFYYGTKNIDAVFPFSEIIYREKDFNRCMVLCRKEGDFDDIDEERYYFNIQYNSCLGKKIAITQDGKIRPCIYSDIIIGDLESGNLKDIIEGAKRYWGITKDRVDRCKDCELRHVCFDCREIAYRENKNLYGANPYCRYNPYSGTWQGEPDV